jgi:hypothetical protein
MGYCMHNIRNVVSRINNLISTILTVPIKLQWVKNVDMEESKQTAILEIKWNINSQDGIKI